MFTAIRRVVLFVVPLVALVVGLLTALALSGTLAGAGPATLAGSSLARASIGATSSAGTSLAVAGAAGTSVHTGPAPAAPPGGPPAAALTSTASTSTVFTSVVSGRPVTTLGMGAKGCFRMWWFHADGVRIHASPSLRGRVLGLGYSTDSVPELDVRPGWLKIVDGSITGWVSSQFLEQFAWCPVQYIPRAPHGVS